MINGKKLGKYQEFIFEDFKYQYDATQEKLEILFNYSFDKILNFQEKLIIEVEAEIWEKVDQDVLKKALEPLFIIGGISYYKAYLPNKISGLNLSEGQAEFWTKVYKKGLGEFFYQNKIDFHNLINFTVNREEEETSTSHMFEEKILLPIGGGKDSIVSAEILKKFDLPMTLFSLRDAGPIKNTSEIIGEERMIVERFLDEKLFKLNQEDAFNGHVPITAYISFLLVVMAVIFDFKYLIMSLERSANTGQVIWNGLDVNHQYSKSLEFEKDFRDYLTKYIVKNLEFFSLLRGWNEIKIAKIFANLDKFDQYAGIFTSCNRNFKIQKDENTGLWCGKCPKCAFVYLILAPFIAKNKLIEIFGKDLLDDNHLMQLYEEILGLKNIKPFECVGTFEESRLAFYLLIQKSEWQDDLIIKELAAKLDFSNIDQLKKLLDFDEENFISDKFLALIRDL